MRAHMSQKAQREAWTQHIDGNETAKRSKYGAVRTNGYASKRESEYAGNLAVLERCGKITELREQVRVTLVEGQGKVRPIVWVADFVYKDGYGVVHYVDVKGFRTPVYRLKKRLAALLLGITIEEV